MKHSTKVADAVHILVLIALDESDLSSQGIAKSIATNPAVIRRLMSALRRGGLLHTVQGKALPALSRSPEEITLLDIYRAMEESTPLLHLDTHTNPECLAGVNIQLALQDSYDRLQKTFEEEMKQITLQQIMQDYNRRLQVWRQSSEETYKPENPA